MWATDNDELIERFNRIDCKRENEMVFDNILKVLYDIIYIVGNTELNKNCEKEMKASLLRHFSFYDPANAKEHKKNIKKMFV